jgi:hypothetical protein
VHTLYTQSTLALQDLHTIYTWRTHLAVTTARRKSRPLRSFEALMVRPLISIFVYSLLPKPMDGPPTKCDNIVRHSSTSNPSNVNPSCVGAASLNSVNDLVCAPGKGCVLILQGMCTKEQATAGNTSKQHATKAYRSRQQRVSTQMVYSQSTASLQPVYSQSATNVHLDQRT